MTCNTTSNETLLQWDIFVPDQSVPETRFISSMGSADSAPSLIVGQTMFRFLRTSTSPLTSMMIIDNVAVELNGTRVDCSYGGSVMSSNVIRTGMSYSSIKLANVVRNPIRKHVHPWTPIFTIYT